MLLRIVKNIIVKVIGIGLFYSAFLIAMFYVKNINQKGFKVLVKRFIAAIGFIIVAIFAIECLRGNGDIL
ncbi:hypothetical protein [Lachnobacterium bovis]|uniref:hypothetical protein n=1 Tax=Lachnobacterium bovis TaxID=140626 RepID=UPI00048222AF|nr:hypothetical protein [Lachnobacterium bovis]